MSFRDRKEAGEMLAERLLPYRDEAPIVLGLPRGGVPVAFQVARALKAPLDVWVVRKVGVPWHPELGMGAVAEGGKVFLSREIIDLSRVTDADVMASVRRETAEVARRVRRFRGDRPPPELEGRTVILVDDGIATGGTVRAAIRALRKREPKRIVLAVPVAAAETVAELRPQVDDLVCLLAPRQLFAIGGWYEDFSQVEDSDVAELLERARQARAEEEAASVEGESRPGL